MSCLAILLVWFYLFPGSYFLKSNLFVFVFYINNTIFPLKDIG
jgi:hypothetical protein